MDFNNKYNIKRIKSILLSLILIVVLTGCGNKMVGTYKMTRYKIDGAENMTKDIKKLYDKYDIFYGTLTVDDNNKAKLYLTGEDETQTYKYNEDSFTDSDSNELSYDFDENSGELSLNGKIDGQKVKMSFEKMTEEEEKQAKKPVDEDDLDKIIQALEKGKRATDIEAYNSLVEAANVALTNENVYLAVWKEDITIGFSSKGVTFNGTPSESCTDEVCQVMKRSLPNLDEMKVKADWSDWSHKGNFEILLSSEGAYGAKVTKVDGKYPVNSDEKPKNSDDELWRELEEALKDIDWD